MKRLFNLFLGALAMLAVALLSAFIAMRLAIHGREVVVPNLAGLSITDASKEAGHLGLSLTLENKFYSPSIPAGHILAQSPAPGSKVRRSWAVRVTGSLGPQSVTIPNLVGLSERAATINLRQQSLDLGAIARIPAPGEPGIVLAQSPPANAENVDSPRISLLVSDTLPAAGAAPAPLTPASSTAVGPAPQPVPPTVPAPSQPRTVPLAAPATQPSNAAPSSQPVTAGFPMPSLTGLTLSAAYARAAASGLHVVSIQHAAAPAGQAATAASAAPKVIAQTPAAGQHVIKGAEVHLTLQ